MKIWTILAVLAALIVTSTAEAGLLRRDVVRVRCDGSFVSRIKPDGHRIQKVKQGVGRVVKCVGGVCR